MRARDVIAVDGTHARALNAMVEQNDRCAVVLSLAGRSLGEGDRDTVRLRTIVPFEQIVNGI